MGPIAPSAVVAGPGPLRPEDSLNVRDAISAFVGKRYIGTADDNARALYSYLRMKLGGDTAFKLLKHISIFNQRPDMLKVSPEQRVQSFYDIGSNDPELNTLINRSSMVAHGPMAGLNDSPQVLNRDILGQKWFLNDRPAAPSAASLQNIKNASAAIR